MIDYTTLHTMVKDARSSALVAKETNGVPFATHQLSVAIPDRLGWRTRYEFRFREIEPTALNGQATT